MMERREKMFTIAVNKAGYEGVYKGAGTKEEVYQDMNNLKAKGIRPGEMKILPIIGAPRTKIVEKTVYVETSSDPDDELRGSSISTGTALAVGAVGGGAAVIGGYLIYRRLKKK